VFTFNFFTFNSQRFFSPYSVRCVDSALNILSPEIYDDAVKDWESQFPAFAKWGWGPTVQAEKWNGRHAMFGWLFICATAYAKGHGLIPDADALLDVKEWGSLAIISGKQTITNERAVILFANVHFFVWSLVSAFAPPNWLDPLFLDPNSDRYDSLIAREKSPFGYLPALKPGFTEETEAIHGRFAMVGLTALIFSTALTGKPMLDIVNEWVGGAYY
jgi:hypothetical protein